MKMKLKAFYLSALALAAFTAVGAAQEINAAVYSAPVSSQSVSQVRLVPCGTPFGIKMLTDGVVVTDFGYVNGSVSQNSPAETAGVKIGDVITAVNGKSVFTSEELTAAVQDDPEQCVISLLRSGEEMEISAAPVISSEDGTYKIGLWTRDSCAGIGTMTFYDPETKIYGGLGHAVSDASTGQKLPLLEGEITAVTITDVLKGSSGTPGELCGAFVSDTKTGSVEINSEYGVFGYSETAPVLNEPLELAGKDEIKKGKATIYTTVAGMMPQEYEIEIVKIDKGSSSTVRNMTIRVTDRELLSRTGGIVQGMSGSPIIQNGKLIGAVTHVLVNDSAMGYGVFIENMYSAAATLGDNFA